MSENGETQTHSRKSVIGEALELLEDQMELTSLEWQYETGQGVRRLLALAAAGVLGVIAFALLQVALVLGLVAVGLSIAQAALLLAAVYGIAAAVLYGKFGKRDKRAGGPFQGTRDEMRKNLQWIRQFFS